MPSHHNRVGSNSIWLSKDRDRNRYVTGIDTHTTQKNIPARFALQKLNLKSTTKVIVTQAP
jgi:hypothetical protein